MNHNLPTVSVVIPVKNEEKNIYKCLYSLLNQTYPPSKMEIFIIDNNSTDKTLVIINKFIKNFPEFNIKLWEKLDGTIGYLRNTGAKKANGKIIAFLDGDCIADRDWLITGVNYIANDSSIGCIGFIDIERTKQHPWVQRAWQHICSTRNCTGCIEVEWLSSFNLIINKNIFMNVGGFNESLKTCEDAEFGNRLKEHTKLILCDTIKIEHLGEPKTLKEFCKKELWRGRDNVKSFFTGTQKKKNLASVFIPIIYFIYVNISLTVSTFILFDKKSIIPITGTIITIIIIPIIITAIKGKNIKNIKRFLNVSFLIFIYLYIRGLSIMIPRYK